MFDGWDLVGETSPHTPSFQLIRVGGQPFAIDSAAAVAVMEPVPATQVPGAPRWVRGVIMWEGQVVPVLGTADRLGLAPTGDVQLLELKVKGEPFFIEIEGLGQVVSALNFERSDQRLILGYVPIENLKVPILDLNVLTDISDEAAT